MTTQDQLTPTCTNQTPPRVWGGWLLVVVVSGLLLGWYGHWCFQAPQPVSAAASDFKVENAWDHLEVIAGSGESHPPGTAEHQRVRDYLIETLQSLGYRVSVQVTEPRMAWEQRQPLENIIALRSADSSGENTSSGAGQGDWKAWDSRRPKLLFVSHYDSHPNGPGAGDAGAAVAALLEVARIEAELVAGDRDIVFLLTDGEEAGLLGAQDWVAECPWLDSIDLVFNFEARGTSGTAYLFETSKGDLNLIRDFAGLAPRPSGNSLAREVYRYMPNGTDFTIFITNRGAGDKELSAKMPSGNLPGLNFAFVGSVENYHTPEDRPENLDRSSLLHHGQTAEALLKFYRSGIVESTTKDAVYFDVAGRWMIWWPENWNWIWLGINILLFVTCVSCCSIGSVRDIVFGGVASLILAITMMLLIWIVVIAFEQKHWFQPFWGRWVPVVGYGGALLAFWCMAIIGWSISGCLIECITKDKSLWVAVWAFWLVLTFVSVTLVPGASFLFLIPLTVACICRLVGNSIPSDVPLQRVVEPLPEQAKENAAVKDVPIKDVPATGWQAEHPFYTSVLPCLLTWFLWFPIQRALLAGLAYRIPYLYIGLVPLLISPVIPLVTVVSYRSKIVLTAVSMFIFLLLVVALLTNQ